MPNIVLLGTCDTKLEELLYLRSQILASGRDPCNVILVDVGRSPTAHPCITVTQEELLRQHSPSSGPPPELSTLPRGEVIKLMSGCARSWVLTSLRSGTALHGIISAGGTGGSSLAAAVMRSALPLGFPKVLVSTAASGDTGPLVGESDVTMMYSVVDIAGLNSLLRQILGNAAAAIVGMAGAYERARGREGETSGREPEHGRGRKVGLTMFGVTTPCVDAARDYLTQQGLECFVFHSTGHGGLAMQRLVEEGELDAVLDFTTTEIADYVVGGVMSAGPERMRVPLEKGVPYLVSLGATDMVNFGPMGTVPEKFAKRKLVEHNPTVTLMRTSPAECRQIGEFIAKKVRNHMRDEGMVELWIPEGGVSMLSVPGAEFHDKEADKALFDAVREGLKGTGVLVREDEREINEEGFAVDAAKKLMEMMELQVARLGVLD